jgi:hypothetical protein
MYRFSYDLVFICVMKYCKNLSEKATGGDFQMDYLLVMAKNVVNFFLMLATGDVAFWGKRLRSRAETGHIPSVLDGSRKDGKRQPFVLLLMEAANLSGLPQGGKDAIVGMSFQLTMITNPEVAGQMTEDPTKQKEYA